MAAAAAAAVAANTLAVPGSAWWLDLGYEGLISYHFPQRPGWHHSTHFCLYPCHGAYAAYKLAGGYNDGPRNLGAPIAAAHTAAQGCSGTAFPPGTTPGAMVHDAWACLLSCVTPNGTPMLLFDPVPVAAQILPMANATPLNPNGSINHFWYFDENSNTVPGSPYYSAFLARVEQQMASNLFSDGEMMDETTARIAVGQDATPRYPTHGNPHLAWAAKLGVAPAALVHLTQPPQAAPEL
tara:strand:+ start:873 stop:1589 length:717 start_codon:yes stop_codon:yes gene_type:complete